MKIFKIGLLGCAMLLSGCSTTLIQSFSEKTYDNMYLRGVFTWWEADENFHLKLVSGKLYAASAKLIADGQPYDFKFADADWTPEYSCGSTLPTGQALSTGMNMIAKCDPSAGNFQFTPKETGNYMFYIDFTDGLEPNVHVERLN